MIKIKKEYKYIFTDSEDVITSIKNCSNLQAFLLHEVSEGYNKILIDSEINKDEIDVFITEQASIDSRYQIPFELDQDIPFEDIKTEWVKSKIIRNNKKEIDLGLRNNSDFPLEFRPSVNGTQIKYDKVNKTITRGQP